MHEPSSFDRASASRPAQPVAGPFGRWLDVCLGLLFAAIGCFIVWMPDAAPGIGRWIAALAIGGLGLEALVAALRNRRSLMSRIGPLP